MYRTKDFMRAMERHFKFADNVLELVQVDSMPDDVFDRVSGKVFPTFCWDNSLLVGLETNASAIVYGCAAFDFDHPLALHCWLKGADGKYYDPTYQKIHDSISRHGEVYHYVLLEIEFQEFLRLSEARGLGMGLHLAVGMDMSTIAACGEFDAYFKRAGSR